MKKYSFTKFILIIVVLSVPLYLTASTLNTTKDLNNFYEEIVNIQTQLNGISQSLYIADQEGESSTSLLQSLSVYNAKIKNLNSQIFNYVANNDISSINKIRLKTLIIAIELLNNLNLTLNELSINKDYEMEYKLLKSFFATDELLTQSLSAFPL
ncbi:hypothetical protein [Niameybacter massiliensis]|uniref:hypothetical protein n=1 Tax=Niameybacter massiliensis TaxID=1658108 RepID=UPI0006B5BCFE|nr:hypothetical protein [Niameybacter massiliensis]